MIFANNENKTEKIMSQNSNNKNYQGKNLPNCRSTKMRCTNCDFPAFLFLKPLPKKIVISLSSVKTQVPVSHSIM